MRILRDTLKVTFIFESTCTLVQVDSGEAAYINAYKYVFWYVIMICNNDM